MRIKRYRRKYAKAIWSWYTETDRHRLTMRCIRALEWFARHDHIPDYGYTGSWRERMEYCSDRMNGGRARAILRLYYAAMLTP